MTLAAEDRAPRARGGPLRTVRPIGESRIRGPFWWQAKGPVNLTARAHATKIDALRAFAADPNNARVLEEFELSADPADRAQRYRLCSGEFDAVNARYDLRGSRRVCSIDDALWNLLPKRGRAGFFVEDLDLATLNAIADAAHAQGRFRLPEPILEQLGEEKAATHAAEMAEEYRRDRWRRRRAPLEDSPPADLDAADRTHGAGWPLTDRECEDDAGRLVPCGDPRAKGEPVRVVYRPSVRGRRSRRYLDPHDPAVQAAREDRAHLIPLREGSGEDASFSFGAEARASGGPVLAGRPYIVGERGPELFVPTSDGRIEAGGISPAVWIAGGIAVVGLVTLAVVFWRRRRRRRRRVSTVEARG